MEDEALDLEAILRRAHAARNLTQGSNLVAVLTRDIDDLVNEIEAMREEIDAWREALDDEITLMNQHANRADAAEARVAELEALLGHKTDGL